MVEAAKRAVDLKAQGEEKECDWGLSDWISRCQSLLHSMNPVQSFLAFARQNIHFRPIPGSAVSRTRWADKGQRRIRFWSDESCILF